MTICYKLYTLVLSLVPPHCVHGRKHGKPTIPYYGRPNITLELQFIIDLKDMHCHRLISAHVKQATATRESEGQKDQHRPSDC